MKKFRSPADWTPRQRHAAYTDSRGGPDACWPWVGGKSKGGYGIFGLNRKSVLAHRAAWAFAHSAMPPAVIKVLHDCDNPACQNPAHLFLGTQADNVADMIAKGRKRVAAGERTGNAKLTVRQVAEIREDGRSQSVIAADYGVTQTTVSRIKLRQTWAAKHGIPLKDPPVAVDR